jgi:hypothetical protein
MPTEHCRVTIQEVVGCLFSTASDKLSAALGVASVPMLLWHQELKDVSEVAALLVPVLSCLWFGIQITAVVRRLVKGKGGE